ncbi:unnamed protein product [Discula destructiva]
MWFNNSTGVKYTADDIPSLQGKVFLVTGGNSGLGRQSVLDLARHEPQEIWLTSRTIEKSNMAVEDIKKSVPNANIKPLAMDLSSFESIRSAARTFATGAKRLDVLMLNAGCMGTPAGLTKDGYELQFGTNHMGHALLTKLLTPVLEKTAAEANSDVRVVVLSSAGVRTAPEGGIVFDTLKAEQEFLSTWARYGQSKLANALFARQLAQNHPQWTVTAIHPGVIQTNLFRHILEQYWLLSPIFHIANRFFSTIEQGTQNQLWAATAPRKDIKTGGFYYPVGDATGGKDRGPYAADEALSKRLWDWTEQELMAQTGKTGEGIIA